MGKEGYRMREGLGLDGEGRVRLKEGARFGWGRRG